MAKSINASHPCLSWPLPDADMFTVSVSVGMNAQFVMTRAAVGFTGFLSVLGQKGVLCIPSVGVGMFYSWLDRI